jgi:hypothetical protein
MRMLTPVSVQSNDAEQVVLGGELSQMVNLEASREFISG